MIERHGIVKFAILLALALLPLSMLIACTSEVTVPTSPEHLEDTHTEARVLTVDQEAIDAAGIEVAQAKTMEVPDFLETTGVISANETRFVHVRPLSEGIVREVYVQKGDQVEEAQALLAYDNIQLGELAKELHSLEAQFRRALAQEDVAVKLWERGKELYRAEAISERELDFRATEFRSAKETVSSYQAEIASTVEKLRRFGATDQQIRGGLDQNSLASIAVLKAPFFGTVIDYDVAPGEVLSPDRVVLTIADLSQVWALADVYERDLAAVAVDREVEITTDSYPKRVFPARVTYIGDAVDPQTRTVKVRCVADNPGRLLKLGMFATVRLRKGSARTSTVVPASAVQMVDNKEVVFVQTDSDRFEPRPVQTGTRWQDWVTVEEGLAPGEPVVMQGAFSLKSELLREALGGGHGH